MLVLQARFAWWRAGTVNASKDGAALHFAPYGRLAFTLKGFGPVASIPLRLTQGMAYCPTPANTSQACIAFGLDLNSPPIAFSTQASTDHDTVVALIGSNRANAMAALSKYGEHAWAAQSVQVCVCVCADGGGGGACVCVHLSLPLRVCVCVCVCE